MSITRVTRRFSTKCHGRFDARNAKMTSDTMRNDFQSLLRGRTVALRFRVGSFCLLLLLLFGSTIATLSNLFSCSVVGGEFTPFPNWNCTPPGCTQRAPVGVVPIAVGAAPPFCHFWLRLLLLLAVPLRIESNVFCTTLPDDGRWVSISPSLLIEFGLSVPALSDVLIAVAPCSAFACCSARIREFASASPVCARERNDPRAAWAPIEWRRSFGGSLRLRGRSFSPFFSSAAK